jgi:hypothetical protein
MATISATVEDLIAEVMAEAQMHDNEKTRVTVFAFDAVRWLYRDSDILPYTNKTKIYDNVIDNREIGFPTDAVSIYYVGTQIGGYVRALACNSSIMSVPEKRSSLVENIDGYNWYIRPNRFIGMGGDNRGDVNVDMANRKIYLSPHSRYSNYVVYYKSNCIKTSRDTCIHPYYIMAFKSYVLARWYQSRKEINMYQTYQQRADVEWRNGNLQKAKEAISLPTIVNIIENNRRRRW